MTSEFGSRSTLQRSRKAWTFAAALLMLGSLSSCGSAAGEAADANLSALSRLYVTYLNMHQGRCPPNAAVFRAFVVDQGKAWLDEAGVDEVDELFVSSSDGQPLAVIYGAQCDAKESGGVIAYQREGVAGKRLVAFRDGAIRRLDDGQLPRVVAGGR